MSKADYLKALKMGEKASKSAAANGEFPYVPALDEFLKTVDVLDEVPVGLMDIPLEQIIGTKTAGRQTAFAPNFMPLMDAKSEFAMKWAGVYDYQMSEGVGDPIIAYEFMNRYYVLEGNKRVSVLKYLNAFSIEGDVIRIIPKRSSDTQVQIFYEYMNFYRHTQINYLWFSREGGFTDLTEALGYPVDEDWTEEQVQHFTSAYVRFSKLYEEKGGKKLRSTIGDAFLRYLSVFPYAGMEDKTDAEIRSEMTKIWSEFTAAGAATHEALLMDPEDAWEEGGLFTRFLALTGQKLLNVAFIYEQSPMHSGWSYSHDLGRMHLEQVYGSRINTTAYTLSEDAQTYAGLIDLAVKDGNTIVFTTSETMLAASLKAAVAYPDVKILNCCVNRPHKLIRTYYGRMYEAKFLQGMIAGAMTGNDKIAFEADYPIWGAIANINAFALGAAATNPRARVYLHWNCVEDSDLEDLLAREDISIVSGVDAMRPGAANRRFGLYRREGDAAVNLAVPLWNWGKFYEKIMHDILSGSWNNAKTERRPALSYWWGISGDIIDLIMARSLPSGLKNLVWTMRDQIYTNAFRPFRGRFEKQDGTFAGEEGKDLSQDEVITMDWFCSNVTGSIPGVDRMNERGRELAAAAGIMSVQMEVDARTTAVMAAKTGEAGGGK